MFSPVAEADTSALDAQLNRFLNIQDRFQSQLLRTVLPASQERTDATINVEPGAHQRPTLWESPRQQHWWFAVGRFLWNGRTGAVRTWTILARLLSGGAGEVVAQNLTDYWQFVFGPQQQMMHMGTWLSLDSYLSVEQPQLISNIQDAWTGANQP